MQNASLAPLFVSVAVVLRLSSSVTVAADADQRQAIHEIERLGGTVERDDKLSGRPVTAIRFKSGSDFSDPDIPLLLPFTSFRRSI